MILTEIAPEERSMFSYSVKNVDWRSYLRDSHFVGLRQHVLKWLRCKKIGRNWTIVIPPSDPEWVGRGDER